MRKRLVIIWLAVFGLMLWFHYTRGQLLLAHEAAGGQIAAAQKAVTAKQWAIATVAYQKALADLPDDAAHHIDRMQLMLEIDKSQIPQDHLIDAIHSLGDRLKHAEEEGNVSPDVTADMRRELASMHYYAGWILRLQGAPAVNWTIETQQARQMFKYLAEAGGTSAEQDARNLEDAVRLERMDLAELRGKPLPEDMNGTNPNAAQEQEAEESQESQKSQDGKKTSGAAKAKGDVRDDPGKINPATGASIGIRGRKGS